jgi:hypothetical protein
MDETLLNITEEMINGCDDAQQLITWRRELKLFSNKMRARLQVMEERFRLGKDKKIQELYVTTADIRAIALARIETVNMRLRVIRGTATKPKSQPGQNMFKEYVKYLKAFKSLAKAKMDEETFSAIDAQAREMSGFNTEDLP